MASGAGLDAPRGRRGNSPSPAGPGCHEAETAETAERAVLADDGREIRLVLYRGAEAVARVELSPIRALALATQLMQAAMPRFSSENRNSMATD